MAVWRSGSDHSGGSRSFWTVVATWLSWIIVFSSVAYPAFAQETPAKIEVLSLNQQLREQASPAAVIKLLQRRRARIEQLMRESPASVRSVMLESSDVRQLAALAPAAVSLVEKEGQWSGPLELLAEDDFDHNRSITHWRVHTAKGPVELFFAHGAPLVKATCSPRVTVTGIGTTSRVAVDAVVALSSSPPVCSTKGVQHVAVILLTMPSAKTFPTGFDAAYFQELFFANSGYSLNTYWDESSYRQTSATGQVFGPFALPNDFNCTDNDNLAVAAIQAATSVDFTQFDRVALIFPVQTCSYGGLGTIGCWETLVPNQNISIAWLPIFPYQQTSNYIGTVTHETGHNLGLNHSNTLDYGSVPVGAFDETGSNTEYGDPFSVMGQVWTVDGTQKIFGQYDAEHKSLDLDWLDLSDGGYQEVVASGSFTLLPFESSSGLRALRVLRDPIEGGWLWLEYRQPIGQVDSTFSFLTDLNEPTAVFDGALVHVEYPGLDPLHTYLADLNAVAQPNDFYNAPLTSGQTWSDPYSPLTLSVSNADSNGLSATVTYDPPCATLSLSGSPFPASGASGSIAVTAPSSCSWAAVTRTNWITLNGTASGHGNGTVNFTVASSPGGTLQRNGYIAVQRQSLQVIQAGTGAVVLGASPSFGTGKSATMTFSFSDPHGFAGISSANINVSSLANPSLDACSMFVDRASGTLLLLNDLGTQYLSPLNLTAPGTSASNSQCTVSAGGSSISGSGNKLQITLQLTFASSFVGSHNVVATVSDSTLGPSNPLQVATWVVPLNNSGIPSVLLNPASVDFGNRPIGNQSLPSLVTLSNSGTGLLHISSISIAGGSIADFSQSNNCGSTVAAGASCTVQVSFTPSATGNSSASLLITDSAGGSPQSVSLTGSGGTIPVASVNPSNLIFASQGVGTKSSASGITFSNSGSDGLAISGISLTGNNAADFAQTNNCGSSLAAGASCNISVIFSPSEAGSRLGAISIADNASGSPQIIDISASATDFVVASADGTTSATVSAGQTATYHLQLAAENGFSGSVSLACSDAVPLSSCMPSQAGPIALNGAAVPFSVQVSTTGLPVTASGTIGEFPGGGLLPLLLSLALALFGAIRRAQWKAGLCSAIVLVCFSFGGCGGGGGSSPAPRVTPAGTYQITVNASASGVTRPIVLTLKVQ